MDVDYVCLIYSSSKYDLTKHAQTTKSDAREQYLKDKHNYKVYSSLFICLLDQIKMPMSIKYDAKQICKQQTKFTYGDGKVLDFLKLAPISFQK